MEKHSDFDITKCVIILIMIYFFHFIFEKEMRKKKSYLKHIPCNYILSARQI